MQTHAKISDEKGRRRFLTSALLGGASIALTGKQANGEAYLTSRLVVRTVLPSVVDSLRRYAEVAGELPYEILDDLYSERILPISVRIKNLFGTLSDGLRDVMANPQFRNNEDAQRLRTLIQNGFGSSLGFSERLEDFSQNYDVVSLVVNGLVLSVNSRQQSSSSGFWQTWTETAHETISQLSVAVESLQSLKSTMAETNKASQKEVQIIQDKLQRAAQMLSNDDGSDSSATRSVQTKAVAEVRKARNHLVTVKELLQPSQKFDSVRSLELVLDGCVTWIKTGGYFNENALNTRRVRAGHHVNPGVTSSGLWSSVRQVLSEILPTNTTTRALACTVLVGPILVGYQDESTRFNLIYEVLPNLLPRGEHDTSDNKRKTAAERLSRVVI